MPSIKTLKLIMVSYVEAENGFPHEKMLYHGYDARLIQRPISLIPSINIKILWGTMPRIRDIKSNKIPSMPKGALALVQETKLTFTEGALCSRILTRCSGEQRGSWIKGKGGVTERVPVRGHVCTEFEGRMGIRYIKKEDVGQKGTWWLTGWQKCVAQMGLEWLGCLV